MKKLFSIFTIALIATAIVSCDKEDEKTNDNGTELNIPANTLIYDGNTYTFSNVMVDYYHDELTLITAETADTLEDGTPRLMLDGIHITPEAWNRDFNLADISQWPVEYVMINLVFTGVLDISYTSFVNGNRGVSGSLDGEYYESESIFTSGTYRVSGNNDGTPITITVDGVLRNGKTLQLKLVTPSYQNQINNR